MNRPTSPRSDSRTEATRRTSTSWDASRPPTVTDQPRGADRLAPYQSDAPHRQAPRTHVPAGAVPGTPQAKATTHGGAERPIPPSAPLAVSPRTVRHTAPPRRRRWWRAAATTGALVMLPFLPVSEHARNGEKKPGFEDRDHADTRDPAVAAGVSRLEASRVAYSEREAREDAAQEGRSMVASYEDLELAGISDDTEVIGFHEAYYSGGLSLTPEGPVQANLNPGKSEVEADADAPTEPMSMILPPRNRATHAHSAIDVAMPVGSDVVSPVDGTVVSVSEYHLYGQYLDTRIEIRPDDRPDIVLVMLHVTDAQVEVGDAVAAGRTVVADGPTAFPFESQIDRFAAEVAGQALPHVHLELKRVA